MYGMRVVELEIHGPRKPRKQNLDHQLVVVSGPTNTGKTSMAECIAFCLGQKVDWKKAFDYVTECRLQIRIGREEYILRRSLHQPAKNYIEIFNLGYELEKRLPVAATGSDPSPTFSDWILTRLSIKDAIDSDDIRALNPKASRLTFTDVWAYLYRMQSELDRQVILHPGGRDTVRRELFELMFRLSEPKIRILRARQAEARRSAVEQEKVLANVEEFFSDTGTRPEHAAVDHQAATDDLNRTTEALRQARGEIRKWEKTRQGIRNEYLGAQQRWRRASTRLEQNRAALRAMAGAGHGYCGDCPACGQQVAVDRAPADKCGLCLQPLEVVTGRADQVEAARRAVHEAEQENEHALEALSAALNALDRHDESDPVHARQIIDDLTALQAAARERIDRLEAGLAQTKRLQELKAGAKAARQEEASLKRDIDVLRGQTPSRGAILAEVEERVRDEITLIDPPWFNGEVRLDRTLFTPLVDGQRFQQLGGGVQAAVNIALSFGYARAALGATHAAALMPQFLMVDAIRKNIGSNKQDQAFARRLYERASFLAGSLDNSGGQLIVFDNDGWPSGPHADRLRYYPYKSVKLSYEDPLVLGVSHADTGEDPAAPESV